MTAIPLQKHRVGISVGLLCAFAAWFALVAAGVTVWRIGIARSLVIAPVAATVTITLIFILYLGRNGPRRLPVLEIGAFYAFLIMLYATWPLLVAIANNYEYPVTAEWRLSAPSVGLAGLVRFTWWYVVYLVSFCLAYALVRRRHALPLRAGVKAPPLSVIAAAVLILIATHVLSALIRSFYHLDAASYIESYLLVQQLPSGIRQVFSLLFGMEFTTRLLLAVSLLCYYKRARWLLIIAVVATIAFNLLVPGGRTELMLLLFICLQAYDLLVRPVPIRGFIVMGVVAMSLYMVIGIIRTPEMTLTDLLKMNQSYTEFEGIFGNAVDIEYIQQADGMFRSRPELYWANVTAVIPQQLLPFAKDDAASWFGRTYYPDYTAQGGGMAFGVLAEAVAGFGLGELVWRGALIGFFFGLMQRHITRRKISLVFLLFYGWLTAWAFHTLRTGTFSLLMLIEYRFIVAVVAVYAVAYLVRRGRRRLEGAMVPKRETAGTS
jgi:hypothetical protein